MNPTFPTYGSTMMAAMRRRAHEIGRRRRERHWTARERETRQCRGHTGAVRGASVATPEPPSRKAIASDNIRRTSR